MHLNGKAQIIAANLADAIAQSGASIDSVARVTGIDPSDMADRVNPDIALGYPFADLVAVAGFLHVPTSTFYEGVNE